MPEAGEGVGAEVVAGRPQRTGEIYLGPRWQDRWVDRLTTLFRGRPGSVVDRLLTIAFVALGSGVVLARSLRGAMRQLLGRFA